MTRVRRNMQAVAVVLGLALLLVAGVAAAGDQWLVAAEAVLVVLALMLVMVAHTHKRAGDTMRHVLRSQKEMRRSSARQSGRAAEDAGAPVDLDGLLELGEKQRRELADAVVAAVERDLAVSRGQLVARLDLVEGELRGLARELVGAAALLDERARTLQEGGAD